MFDNIDKHYRLIAKGIFPFGEGIKFFGRKTYLFSQNPDGWEIFIKRNIFVNIIITLFWIIKDILNQNYSEATIKTQGIYSLKKCK